MYLKTPRRYSTRRQKRNLFNLRWLWLYLITPPAIIGLLIVWNLRTEISNSLNVWVGRNVRVAQIFAPTPTATLPAKDLETRIMTSLESGSINDALDAMASYTESVKNETVWHPLLAQTLIMRNSKDPTVQAQALQAGLRAINANPEAPDGWIATALVMDYAEDSARALGYALHGKELGDSTGMASAVLAGIYYSLSDYKTAGTYADEALKANPNLAYGYYVRAQIAQSSGAPKEAIQWYRQAMQASNNDKKQWGGYIVVDLAGLYSSQDQEDQATKLLTDAITRDKDYPGLMYQLANIYFKNGNFTKAMETSLSCIDRSANYAPCYVVATKTQYHDGLWEKAAQSAQRAAALGSPETGVYYYGGLAFYKLNLCAQAVPLFNAGLALAEKLKKEQSIKSDFAEALTTCGTSAASDIGTLTPTPIIVTATPRKK